MNPLKVLNVLTDKIINADAPAPQAAKYEPDETVRFADDALIIVPVRNMVLFPGMIVPIAIGRESSIAAAQYAIKAERPIGVLLQRNPEVETPDGTHHIVCLGQQRFRVLG